MDLSVEEINSILKFELESKNYEYVSIEKAEKKGYVPVGFLSGTKKLCLKYKIDGHLKELHLFVKLLPEAEFHKNLVTTTGAFSKEVILFENFLNDLKKDIKVDLIPTCYIAKDNDKIVLKDLASLGFKNVPTQSFLTIEHCEKSTEAIAKLHAESLAFEIKTGSKIYEHLPVLLKESFFSTDSGKQVTKVGIKALRAIQKKYLPHYPNELVDRVYDFMSKIWDVMVPSSTCPNVFSHCDVWVNNIMFRYDEDKVQECCLVDFQLAALRPVGCDLLMLIYTTLDKKDLDSHYDYFVKYYYDQLSENLALKNIELAQLLPWDKYLTLISDLKTLFLALAPQYLHFITMPEEIISDVINDDDKYCQYYFEDRNEFVLKAAAEYPEYKSRLLNSLIDVFNHFNDPQNVSNI